MARIEIDEIYQELRENFIVIGLTGALGGGCTKTANILSEKMSKDAIINFSLSDDFHADSLESYRFKKVMNFVKDKDWKSFYHIKVSNLLFCLFFNHDEKYLQDDYDVKKWLKQDGMSLDQIRKLCKRICSMIINPRNAHMENTERILTILLEELNGVIATQIIKNGTSYTRVFQCIGSELRSKGLSSYLASTDIYKNKVANVFSIADFVKKTIKRLRYENHNFFVIDALRNVHEINYFKARYSNFYLFSINADEEIRKNRILSEFEFTIPEYEKIVKTEQDKEKNHSQNINECLGNGDVFISNNGDINSLKYQLIKYISLIRKPGLFTPSSDERNMQIALTARYNSGCISRQVGACVVGIDGYVLGIGWNDVQEGAIPCLYRSSQSLLMDNNGAPEFSQYEMTETFKGYVRNDIGINNQAFCFKDIENKHNADEMIHILLLKEEANISENLREKLASKFKNPTRERALHAEENAFLQSSKIGGGALKGSILYTTASPCQLCAKKAMQLGVKRIVYIDAYPDISRQQTLESGAVAQYPAFDAFSGVAESAFMKLYKPLINIKDEIKELKS